MLSCEAPCDEALIDHGATLDEADKRGRTSLDVAQGVRAPGEAQRMKTSPLREASAAFLRQSSALNVGEPHR
jgi:hypothetical protein